MPDIASGPPDTATSAEVVRLARRIEAEDGAPPLSDQTLSHLHSPAVDHAVLRADGRLAGYAQRDGDSAELATTVSALGDLLDHLDRPGLRVWAHGRRSRLVPVLEARGWARARELHQLRRPLDTVPAEPPLPAGVAVRPFVVGRDDDAWLVVNAAAFAAHPEQGRWTAADLQARIAEEWFDPAGFLLAERGSELLGYHWTKVHPAAGSTGPLGEVYVLGVDPAARGLHLGRVLTLAGLRHLYERGLRTVLLYVEADNEAAVGLYSALGFTRWHTDVMYAR